MPFKPSPAPPAWLAECRLLAELKAGKERALARFTAEQMPGLQRLAVALAASDEAADRLLDTALTTAVQWSSTRREDQPLGPWLWGLMLSAARERKPAPLPPEPVGELPQRPVRDWSGGAADPAARAALQATLMASGRQLPRHLHVTWLLADVLGLPAAEIAAVIDLSPGAVKGRLHRARLILREALATQQAAPPNTTPPAPAPVSMAAAAPEAGPGGMSCADFSSRLRAGLTGELATGRQAAWEAHRAGCGDCGALAGTYGLTVELARRTDEPPLPAAETLAARVTAALARARQAAVVVESPPAVP
jgi:RNA polymerase sigma-70 factor (ECF subfamily)